MNKTVSLRYTAAGGSLFFVDAAGVRHNVPGGARFVTDAATAAILLASPDVVEDVEEAVTVSESAIPEQPVTFASGAEVAEVVEPEAAPAVTGAITLTDIPAGGKRGKAKP